MSEIIRVLEWNIKGSAALPWAKPYVIKKELVDKVMDQKADIIILVEFCIASGWDYFEKRLLEEGYAFFMSCLTGKNGVLICIKSNLIKETKQTVYDNFKQVISHNFDDYNLLRVSFKMKNGRKATVMGLRIETSLGKSSPEEEEYNRRGKAFEEFLRTLENLSKNEICIVAGDFNNAKCYGDLATMYDPQNYIKKGKKRAQYNYNLNIIRDKFNDLGFKMLDIGNGLGIPTWGNTKKKYVPDDHIFVRGLALENIACNTITDDDLDDLSDHTILLAEFSFDCDAK